jgi:hypothetical protein
MCACGGATYRASVNAAEVRLAQAHDLGADTAAPFEYYAAREHLEAARGDAEEGSLGDARAEADAAEVYAQKAIDSVRASRHDGPAATSR